MAVGAVVARILTQYSDKGSKQAQKDIQKLGRNIDNFSKKAVKAFAVAAAASAAFAVKIGKDAVAAAIEDSKSSAILAQTLQNVTGATRESIAAVEEYIRKQQLASTVADDELRKSLGALVTATGNASDAMFLQGIALDTAAGTGRDLQSVTLALVKAQQGNLGALKRLGIPLDDNIVKTKDFAAAIEVLESSYKGQAELLGNTNPLKRLQIAYGEVLETLGYALLPVVVEFTEYLQTDVLPAIEEWVKLNEENLQKGLRESAILVKDLIKAGLGLAEFVVKYKEAFLVIGATVAALEVIAKINAFIFAFKAAGAGVTMLGRALGLIPPAASAAAGATTAAGTAAAAAGAKALIPWRLLLLAFGKIGLVITGFTLLWKGLDYLLGKSAQADIKRKAQQEIAMSKMTESAVRGYDAIEKAVFRVRNEEYNRQRILDGFKPIEAATKAANKAKVDSLKEEADRIARLNKIKKEQAKRDAEQARLDARILAVKKALGVQGQNALDKETDIKQLNAAEALIKRQNDINKIDLDRIKAMKEEIISLGVRNDLAARYVDILRVIADEKITDAEVKALALGWKLPEEAVRAYLIQFQAVADGTISDDEIIKLAKSWGSTQEQAAKYLDFFTYLNDGILSDAEIEKLKTKWGMTEEQVRMYADFVGIVNDGKLEDAEIIKIQAKWKLTTDQVVDYIKKIGSPVSYSGTLIDPARAAEIGWLNAIAALERYLALLKAGTGVVVGGSSSSGGFVPGSGNDPAVIAAAVAASAAAEAAAADAAAVAAEAEAAAAEAEAAVAAASGTFLNLIREATTTEAINTAVQVAQIVGESASDIANAMMVGLLGQGVDAASAASSARYTGQAIAAMQAAEARAKADAEAAARALSSGQVKANDMALSGFTPVSSNDYDERFRFNRGTVATAQGISGGNLMAAPVVNITVQGSVTAEQDLVQTVRNGLLSTQYNGNQLLLEAI